MPRWVVAYSRAGTIGYASLRFSSSERAGALVTSRTCDRKAITKHYVRVRGTCIHTIMRVYEKGEGRAYNSCVTGVDVEKFCVSTLLSFTLLYLGCHPTLVSSCLLLSPPHPYTHTPTHHHTQSPTRTHVHQATPNTHHPSPVRPQSPMVVCMRACAYVIQSAIRVTMTFYAHPCSSHEFPSCGDIRPYDILNNSMTRYRVTPRSNRLTRSSVVGFSQVRVVVQPEQV